MTTARTPGRHTGRQRGAGPSPGLLSRAVVDLLVGSERTVAVAEAATSGLLAHELTIVSGADAVFVGGLVSYGGRATSPLLALPEGAVDHPDAARQLATRTRRLLGADVAVATAGRLDPEAGRALALVAVDLGHDVRTASYDLRGTVEGMRRLATTAALQVLLTALSGRPGADPAGRDGRWPRRPAPTGSGPVRPG